MIPITDDLRRRRLAARHALTPGSRVETLASAADAVVALHSSDPTSVFLSAAARLRAPTVAAIEHDLYDDRTVLRHHAMRRTIWVMTPEAAQAANAGFSRKFAQGERRRTAMLFGKDAGWVGDGIERVVAVVRAADRPIGARQIGLALPDLAEQRVVNAGKPYEGTMAPHTRLLLCAAFEGRVARGRPSGSWIGSQYTWTPSETWLPVDWSRPDEVTGATEIVGRYLERFGPATTDDVTWWTGATKTLVRRALDQVGAVSVSLEDGSTGWVRPDDLPDDAGDHDPSPWVALLPGLDPTAMGWRLRSWYLDHDVSARVTDRNGNIGPTVWVDGRVVGGWAQRSDGSIAHDAPGLSTSHQRLLAVEIERLREFVGDARFSVRFPAPNQRTLLAGD